MKLSNKAIVLVSSFVLSLVLVACAQTEVKDVSDQVKESDLPNVANELVEKTYSIGDTVSVDGMDITIDSAKFTDPSEYSEPVNGKILSLELTVKNTNSIQSFVDNTEFSVYSNEGLKMEDYYGYDDMAISDNVNAGKQLKGKLYFDVVEQDNYELIYTPSFSMDGKEIFFDLKMN